jgi:hypothetical protein
MTLTTGSLEERVGISQFLNKDNPGFRGTIKERGVPNSAQRGHSSSVVDPDPHQIKIRILI